MAKMPMPKGMKKVSGMAKKAGKMMKRGMKKTKMYK